MKKETYIFGETEYVLTGREAEKKLPSGRIEVKLEIRPVSVTDPTNRNYNKWVKRSELFAVSGDDGE